MKKCEDVKLGMILVKGPKGAKAGSDNGRQLRMPPTPTVLIV